MAETTPALNGEALFGALWSAILKQGRSVMPFLRFDLVEGRSEPDVRKILDVTHEDRARPRHCEGG